MKKLLKKYSWIGNAIFVILFSSLAILLPYLLNVLMLKPARFEFIGCDKDWLGFWATYIGATASFAMVLITWQTLKQMKKQWEDEHRPLLEFYFIKGTLPMDKDKYPVEGHKIEVLNIGKSPATELNFSISQEIINCAKDSVAKEALSKIGSDIQLSLLPNEARRFTLCEQTTNRENPYYIADVKVDEKTYKDFTMKIKGLKIMHLKGTYNQGRYKIDIKIPITGIRNSHVSITEAIMNIKSSFDNYMLSIENNGFNVNIKNDDTKQ